MLYLLFSVPLNSSEKCLQLILLPLTKDSLLFGELDLELLLHVVNFFLFERLADEFDLLGVDVIFDAEVNLLLLSEIDDLLVPSMIVIKLLSHIFPHLIDLMNLLCFKLLN